MHRSKNLEDLNSKSEPEILTKINSNLELLLEQANKGFGLPSTEDEILNRLINLDSEFKRVSGAAEKLMSGYTPRPISN